MFGVPAGTTWAATHRVAADALHGQKATARATVERHGDDVLAVKGNQKTLLEGTRLLFDDSDAAPEDTAQAACGDAADRDLPHRIAHNVARLAERFGVSGLRAVGEVEATREPDDKVTSACRYYILATPLSTAGFLKVVRSHCHLENQSRAHKGHGPETLTRLRRFALNILRANKDKGSMRGKLERAARDDTFLLELRAA